MNRLLLCLLVLLPCPVSWAAENIKVGMSTALTGPAAALGLDMQVGIESYFDQINSQGGISGRLLELIVRDDGYEPERAALNMHELIDKENVLAVIGNVGTPTAIVTVPIAIEAKTLLFGAFSGGDILRPIPANRYVINYRASYAEEAAEMVSGLLKVGIQPQHIAFFTQQDSYGNTGYRGAINALHKQGFEDTDQLIHGRYTRNTLNVEDAVSIILDAVITPKVVIMVGGYAPSAKFIELLQQDLPDTWFVNMSFVGSHALKGALMHDKGNVIVTQVVPNLGSSLPIIQEYLAALGQFDNTAEANDVSLEGFIVAKIFCQGLFNIRGDINRESIIAGIESIKGLDVGLGVTIDYDKTDHQAIHDLWLTSIQAGKLKPFSWSMLK